MQYEEDGKNANEDEGSDEPRNTPRLRRETATFSNQNATSWTSPIQARQITPNLGSFSFFFFLFFFLIC